VKEKEKSRFARVLKASVGEEEPHSVSGGGGGERSNELGKRKRKTKPTSEKSDFVDGGRRF